MKYFEVSRVGLLIIILGFLSGFKVSADTTQARLNFYQQNNLTYNQIYEQGPNSWDRLPVVKPEMFHPKRDHQFYELGSEHKGYFHIDEDKQTPQLLQELGGDWGSSGGDGVVCFSSQSEEDLANQQIQDQGFVTPDLLMRAESAHALEVFEFLLEKGDLNEAELLSSKRVGGLNSSFEKRLETYTPSIFYHLKTLKGLHPSSSWVKAQVSDVPDSVISFGEFDEHLPKKLNPQFSDEEVLKRKQLFENSHCVIHQVILRVSQRDVTGYRPKATFFYNPVIFEEKFSDLSKSIMELHEHLYFMSSTTGHISSNAIRAVIRFNFFESSWDSFIHESNDKDEYNMIQSMRFLLGDFQGLWSNSLKEVAEKFPNHRSSNFYKEFFEVVREVRRVRTQCIQAFEEKSSLELDSLLQLSSEHQPTLADFFGDQKLYCQYLAIEGTNYIDTFNPAQMFFFLSHFYLDQISQYMSARIFATFDQENPALSDSRWTEAIVNACVYLRSPRVFFDYKFHWNNKRKIMGTFRENHFIKAVDFCISQGH